MAKANHLAQRNSSSQLVDKMNFWLWWWRDVWLIQHNLDDNCVNVDCERELHPLAARLQSADVMAFLQRLERAIRYMNANVNSRLIMTSLMLHMPMAAN